MSRATETRDAIRRITDAAGRVAADKKIVKPLVASTGLSREGVQHALAECLETYPSDDEIDAMVGRAPTAKRVHVILSANVFTAPLRAIAWARAIASKVSVSISSREPVFATALLKAIADSAIFRADREAIDALDVGDELHIYGRTETIDAVRSRAPAGVVIRAHGPGLGIAFLSLRDRGTAFERLADDIIAFDQRGCLSPRIVFVEVDDDPMTSMAVAASIGSVLDRTPIPRGMLNDLEKEESRRYVETMRVVGSVDVGSSFVVGLAPKIILAPTGRHVHCVPVRDWREAERLLAPIAGYVTAIGSSDLTIGRIFSHSVRISDFGKMQKPPFDGPVDVRAI